MQVTFVAGYGVAVAVPEGIKAWIKIRVGSMFANREEISTDRIWPVSFIDSVLDPFRVVTL